MKSKKKNKKTIFLLIAPLLVFGILSIAIATIAQNNYVKFKPKAYEKNKTQTLSIQPFTKITPGFEKVSPSGKIMYSFQDLGTLGGTVTMPRDINNKKFIVGNSRDIYGHGRAFIWNPNTQLIEPLKMDLPNENCSSYATGVNNSELISGFYECNNGLEKTAFVFDYNSGRLNLLSHLTSNNQISEAYGLNEFGYSVGRSNNTAVVWTPDGKIIDLSNYIPNTYMSFALKINDRGTIIGGYSIVQNVLERAFVIRNFYSNPEYRDLGLLPDTDSTIVGDINNEDIIVGYGHLGQTGNLIPFKWVNSTFQILPKYNSTASTHAIGINNNNIIVGGGGITITHGLLWESNSLFDVNKIANGIPSGRIINGNGQINDRNDITCIYGGGTGIIRGCVLRRIR